MPRGGARNYPKGTGPRVRLACLVDPVTMKRVNELVEKMGVSSGKVIDFLVKSYDETCSNCE